MSNATALRELLASKSPLVVPGGGTPLEALATATAGFPAFYLSGYAIAAWRHGLPDIGLLGAGEAVDALAAVMRVSNLPVIADADTGYGDATSVFSIVRLLESTGAAAIQIEDQVTPKRCGHMIGKEVIDSDEAVRKVATAVAARRNDDTVIIARTDSLAPLGLDEAISRAQRFAAAGADVVFVDAPRSIEELAAIREAVPGYIMANISEGGKTPQVSAGQLHDLGYELVIYPTTALRVAAKGIQDFLGDLVHTGDSGPWLPRMHGLDELNVLVDLDSYLRIGDQAAALDLAPFGPRETATV